MFEKFIEMFIDEKSVDINIRPTFTQIKVYNTDKTTADMMYYDVVKTAKDYDCTIVTYDDIPKFCDESHNKNDEFFHKFNIFKNSVTISIEIYFH